MATAKPEQDILQLPDAAVFGDASVQQPSQGYTHEGAANEGTQGVPQRNENDSLENDTDIETGSFPDREPEERQELPTLSEAAVYGETPVQQPSQGYTHEGAANEGTQGVPQRNENDSLENDTDIETGSFPDREPEERQELPTLSEAAVYGETPVQQPSQGYTHEGAANEGTQGVPQRNENDSLENDTDIETGSFPDREPEERQELPTLSEAAVYGETPVSVHQPSENASQEKTTMIHSANSHIETSCFPDIAPDRQQLPTLLEAAAYGDRSGVCSVTQPPVRKTSSVVPLPSIIPIPDELPVSSAKDCEIKHDSQVVAEEAPSFSNSTTVSAFSSTDCVNASTNNMELMSHQILDEILNKTPTGKKVCKIGTYAITDRSIHYLKCYLSDEVIDAFLDKYTMQKTNFRHINSITMTYIFYGNYDISGFLNEIQSNEELIGAVNVNGNHWVLLIILLNAKILVYMNPLGESQAECDECLKKWSAFLRARWENKQDITTDGWEVRTVPHDTQSDDISCGLYVLMFARQYLSGEAMDKNWTQKDIEKERQRLQLELISIGIKDEPSICSDYYVKKKMRSAKPKRQRPSSGDEIVKRTKYCICNKPDDGGLYWCCKQCQRLWHAKCFKLNAADDTNNFICETCKDNLVQKRKDI